MNTGIVVQARLGSKRFPRKVLANLNGKPVLRHVLDRALEIGPRVILATPDMDLYEYGGIPSVLGYEDDVLSRFVMAARAYSLDFIMRITADCPLLRPDLCRKVLELYRTGDCSYAAIGWPMTYPRGYGCEVFSRKTLELTDAMTTNDKYDREHVTPWMERNLKCAYLTQENDESHLNYSIDTPADLERVREYMNGQNQNNP